MKVCLYLELESILGVSGIGSAINNQRHALELNNVDYTGSLESDFDLIHINVVGVKSLYVARKMKKEGKKVILHAHVTADDFRDSYRFSNSIAPYLQRYLVYYYNQADLILCPSEYTKGVLLRYGVKRPIKVISNGIDVDRFQASEEKRRIFRKNQALDGIVPFMVGHLFIRKGLETFVSVAKEFDNKFFWLGKRYKRLEDPRVRRLVKKAPVNIRFMTFVDDIVGAYSGGDIFFFPSLCENQGIVLLEASACRKPILVRDCPTYKGWLEDGVNCLKAKTDEEFKSQLKRLIEDEKLRDMLAVNAFKSSREHSLENVGRKLRGIYEDLLKR
ncbi:MAG: glycosyltransferase [Candidatus Altiarchaeota archaeon]|nr:glycosyltransferase [Candidatus Altiarchaeota archaeon]